MAGVNKVILVGNLGKDPEIRVTESGRKVANFSLATTESYKDKNGERVDSTEWHNVAFWGPIADVIEKYLKKGSQIYVEGKLRTRSYEDKDKVKKYITEIVGQTMTMLGKPGDGNTSSSSGASRNTVSEPINQSLVAEDDSDDLPF
jgi:single-strand DNA-binding protein